MAQDVSPEWIGIDHRADSATVWAMRGTEVLATRELAIGVSTGAADLADHLRGLISDWQIADGTQIITCGAAAPPRDMADFRAVPCAPLAATPATTPLRIAGLRQASPPDLMQGDETRIAGFLSLNPDWGGVICLTGPQSRWVQISAGEVVSFQTFMTGELAALLSDRSTLQPAVAIDTWDEAAFAEALAETMSRPEKLAARLYGIHAHSLLGETSATSRARLLGYLIGAELAAARAYWLGQQIAVIGADDLAAPYVAALAAQGVPATRASAKRMTLAGLCAAYRLVGAKA